MALPVRLQSIHFENGQELVLAQFEKGIAFTFIELLKVEHVPVKRHCLLDVIDLDHHVITAVNLDRHRALPPPLKRRRSRRWTQFAVVAARLRLGSRPGTAWGVVDQRQALAFYALL